MLYIPIMKNRQSELRSLKKVTQCLGNNIMPLLEIISGDDNDELQIIADNIGDRFAFIDYFRFDDSEYGDYLDYNVKKVELSMKLRNDFDLYKCKLNDIKAYKSFIPVFSLKPHISFSVSDSEKIISDLRRSCNRIAIRIDISLFDEYKDALLRSNTYDNDYLLIV